ncbi:MAG: hypothetical protein AAB019_08295 [Planctomycetota bacterium]
MGNYEQDYDDLKTNDLDNVIPAGRPPSFDNFITRFAPLLINLEPSEIELIKLAYLTAIKNNGQIEDKLLAKVLQISERTIRNRKSKIIKKINIALGLKYGKSLPPLEDN